LCLHTHTRSQARRETAANMFSDMAQEAVFVLRSYRTQWTLELSLLSTFHSQVTKQTFTPAVATSTQFAAELTIAIIVQMQPWQIQCIYNIIINSLKLHSNMFSSQHGNKLQQNIKVTSHQTSCHCHRYHHHYQGQHC
jgi:hypothetical protein